MRPILQLPVWLRARPALRLGPGTPAERAFTLIELLTTIAIIALLAALLLPALNRGKRSAASAACLSNLRQIGVALELYVQDNEHHLPVCAMLPSLSTNPPLPVVLSNYTASPAVFQCREDRTYFAREKTSYEWNEFLNGASYDRPEDWSPTTKAIVETIFGGRLNTPLVGDADAFHPASGSQLGKNALFFDGRVAASNWKRPRP